MRENTITINTVLPADAAILTAKNQNGAVWPAGMYVIVDNSRAIVETREEADELIRQIQSCRGALWPPR